MDKRPEHFAKYFRTITQQDEFDKLDRDPDTRQILRRFFGDLIDVGPKD